MKTTLFDLWNGNLCPVKECFKDNKEIEELEKLISRNSEKLLESFNDEQCKRFDVFIGCINEYIMLTNESSFSYGIGLVLKLIHEST